MYWMCQEEKGMTLHGLCTAYAPTLVLEIVWNIYFGVSVISDLDTDFKKKGTREFGDGKEDRNLHPRVRCKFPQMQLHQ